MARGVVFNLLQMAKRISPQYKAAEYEDLSGEIRAAHEGGGRATTINLVVAQVYTPRYYYGMCRGAR